MQSRRRKNNNPHAHGGMFTYEKLIAAIERLEAKEIISFEEFKQLPVNDIIQHYFPTPKPTMILRAITKIEDKRNNKEGLSEQEVNNTQ